ncbi:hypothetical protein HRbin40_02092 [bacterium HR40]|nr:hypothetical protein HRbin40_02092 [bacterium HR40]
MAGDLLQFLFAGITVGAIYAPIALGFCPVSRASWKSSGSAPSTPAILSARANEVRFRTCVLSLSVHRPGET